MVRMSGAEGGAEKRRPVTIYDVYFKSLYANWKFPQTGAAIVSTVLSTILSASNPKELLQEYLSSSLEEEGAAHYLTQAEEAHAKYLPPEKRPQLTLERMMQLWKIEHAIVARTLYELLIGIKDPSQKDLTEEETAQLALYLQESDLPVDELQFGFRSVMRAITRPDLQASLEDYRNEFEKGEWETDWRENPVLVERFNKVLMELVGVLKRDIAAEAHIPTHIAKRFLSHLKSQAIVQPQREPNRYAA